jgi:hypothetical protein
MWPFSKEILTMVSDGKITKEELHLALDTILDGREEVKLW